MKEYSSRAIKILQYVELTTFIITVILITIFPSAEHLNQTGQLTGGKIFLSQIRGFFLIPFCYASAIGCLVTTTCVKKIRFIPQRRSWGFVCFFCMIIGAILGIYFGVGFVGFHVNPPMSFDVGIYIMNNRWIISVWWIVNAILLTASIVLISKKESDKNDK